MSALSIIWDLGGTLLDTYPDVDRALACSAFGEASAPRLAQVAALTRVSSGHAIRVLAERTGRDEQRLRAAYDGVKEAWRDQPPPVMDGAREVMEAVRRGGGSNLVATHRDRSSAEQLLAATGIEVDDLICAPDGHARKPDPEMIEILLDRHGLEASQALAVGDRPVDAEAAGAAGLRARLLVAGGDGGGEPGARRIASLRELLEELECSEASAQR